MVGGGDAMWTEQFVSELQQLNENELRSQVRPRTACHGPSTRRHAHRIVGVMRANGVRCQPCMTPPVRHHPNPSARHFGGTPAHRDRWAGRAGSSLNAPKRL